MRTTRMPRFDKLVELHYPPLFHFATRLCSSPENALELTQRTFHVALNRSRDLPVPTNVRAWLFAILFREYLEHRPRVRHVRPTVPTGEPVHEYQLN